MTILSKNIFRRNIFVKTPTQPQHILTQPEVGFDMIIGLHIFYHLLLHRMSPTRNSTSTRKNAMILTQPKIGFDMIIGLHIFYHLLPHRMPPTRNSTSTRKNDHRDSKSIKTLQAERAIIRSNEEAPCRSKISHDNL